MVPRWWQRPFRVFQTNLREIDAGLDVAKVLDHLEDLGASAWLLNAGGIVSFYPSDLPFQRPSPWLVERASGDLIGDAIRQAHERGIRVICRIDLSKVDAELAAENPDWCFVTAAGRHQIYNGLHSTCPSGPYYQERSLDILREILRHYQPDAFFFNMFKFTRKDYSGHDHGICHCHNCRSRYGEMFGLDLPDAEDPDDKRYQAWREYTRHTINQCSRKILDTVSDLRPECGVLLKEVSDVTYREANNAVDRPSPLWVHWAGELVQEVVGTDPAKPVAVNSVMFVDIPYRFTAEQPGLVNLHLTQTIAHGGNPMAYVLGTPDVFRPAAYDVVRSVFRLHRDHERYYTGTRSLARVALLSTQTRESYFGEAGPITHVQKERRGIHLALVESHIPFDIVAPELLTQSSPQELRERFDVLILPVPGSLSAPERHAVDEFVRAGGGAVATSQVTGLSTAGDGSANVALECLGALSVDECLTGGQVRSAYLRPAPEEEGVLFGRGRLLALDRQFLAVTPKPEATVGLTLVPPSRYGPPEKCHGESESERPGLLWFRFGRGASAYLPWGPGELYHDLRMPEHREVLAAAIFRVSPRKPLIETAVSPRVEIVPRSQDGPDRTLVHLINYSGHDGRSFHEPLPVYDLSVTVNGRAGSTARSARLGTEIPLCAGPDAVTFDLPRLDDYDLVVIE